MPRQNGFSHLQFYIQNNEQNCLSLVDTMMSLYWCSHVTAVLAIKANLFHQGKKTINARMANSLLYFFCTIEKEIQKKSESSPNYNRSWFLLTFFLRILRRSWFLTPPSSPPSVCFDFTNDSCKNERVENGTIPTFRGRREDYSDRILSAIFHRLCFFSWSFSRRIKQQRGNALPRNEHHKTNH